MNFQDLFSCLDWQPAAEQLWIFHPLRQWYFYPSQPGIDDVMSVQLCLPHMSRVPACPHSSCSCSCIISWECYKLVTKMTGCFQDFFTVVTPVILLWYIWEYSSLMGTLSVPCIYAYWGTVSRNSSLASARASTCLNLSISLTTMISLPSLPERLCCLQYYCLSWSVDPWLESPIASASCAHKLRAVSILEFKGKCCELA